MKNGMVALFFGGSFAFGCASGGAGIGQRGSIVVRADSVKAFVAGPAVVHAFSMDRGGDIYIAPALTGTDADCAGAHIEGRDQATPLKVDQRNVVEVGLGEVACVAAQRERSVEVLWHAKTPAAPANQFLLAQSHR
jgi:hypothetical protein